MEVMITSGGSSKNSSSNVPMRAFGFSVIATTSAINERSLSMIMPFSDSNISNSANILASLLLGRSMTAPSSKISSYVLISETSTAE